jgi:hypothetical protein
MSMDVVGYTEEGEAVYGDVMGGDVMGRHHRHHGHHRLARMPNKPQWRQQLAPGVIQPDEGMLPLPLTPTAGNTAAFSATVTSLTYQGQLQKPFRGERVLVGVARTGASAVGRLLGQFFVGTDLQQADIQSWDLELVGQPGSFGTRLTMHQAEPGVLIRVLVTLSQGLTGTDTIFMSMLLLGRSVH